VLKTLALYSAPEADGYSHGLGLARPADDQRRRLLYGLGPRGAVLEGEVPPREAHVILGPLGVDDLGLFFQDREARGRSGKVKPERPVLRLVPARPQTELDPPVRDVVDGAGHVGQQGRMAEGGGRDHGAEPDARGTGSQTRQSMALAPGPFIDR
jgi:hypothetical protein